MKILALNTATTHTSIALLDQGALIEERLYDDNRSHAQNLIPEIISLLGSHQLIFEQLDQIAVITGPGSFTGIRIGLAAAIGLKIGLNIPIIGVTSFEAYLQAFQNNSARNNPAKEDLLLIAIESLRTELYFQTYNRTNHIFSAPVNLKPDDFFTAQKNLPAIIIGDAGTKLCPFLKTEGISFIEHDEKFNNSLAYHAGCFCQNLPVGTLSNRESPSPFYIRPADAIKATNIRKMSNI